MQLQSIQPNEYNSYYKRYFEQLSPTTALIDGFEQGKANIFQFFEAVPESKLYYQYAADKWTVKEVLQHLIDTERIFSYRAFRIGRGDQTPLANFDQDTYIAPARANEKSRADLLQEYEAVRNNSLILLKSLTDEDLSTVGLASSHPMSARAAAFMILGHEIWHVNIVKARYLID